MYCPQCGNLNDDQAAFCTKCGMDLQKYKEEWSNPQTGSAGAEGEQAPGATPQGTPPPTPTPPPYPQQYQPTYQTPPYQAPPYQASGYQPGGYQPGYGYGNVPNIPSYMGWAIATLILCFWPTGIVAVVYASKVGNRLAVGDIAGAQDASRKAKTWTWVTFGIGVAAVVIAIIVAILVTAAAVTTLNW